MRQPKPFFRKFTKTWYVQIGNKQINLGQDKDDAFQKYHEIMASRGLAEVRFKKVAELFDAFLCWAEQHRSPGTYYNYKHYLTLFAQRLGPAFRIAKLEGNHVTQWIESRADWSSSTGNDAVAIVQRAFNWAVKRGHLPNSPVTIVDGTPKRTRRETVFSSSQWKQLRALVKDPQFGDFLDFMWLTGCRPLEARKIEPHHVDLKNGMVVFPPSEAKGECNERVIFLPDDATIIIKRNMCDVGPLFRNTKGRPWTKDSINCRFQRLAKKLSFPACAYGIRHSFATEGLKKGIDSLTLAQLMGHSDTSMLSKHYAHLSRNPEYLRDSVRKLRAS